MPHGPVVMLTFPTVQGLCRKCDRYVTTCPKEVHPTCHATWRLMRLVSGWATLATNVQVGVMFEICDGTVRRYDKIVLESDTPPPLLDGIEKLLIDEKSVRKGQGYVTVILNGETGELLHMTEGRKKEAVVSFFEKLTEAQRASIVAVGINRAGSYQAAVEERLPHADIVYDRFHLVANVNQAVDEVRRSLWVPDEGPAYAPQAVRCTLLKCALGWGRRAGKTVFPVGGVEPFDAAGNSPVAEFRLGVIAPRVAQSGGELTWGWVYLHAPYAVAPRVEIPGRMPGKRPGSG